MGNSKKQRTSNFKRRRRRGSYVTVTGKYPTTKASHPLYYEGYRERDLYVLLNYVVSVLEVEAQPLTIQYKERNRSRKYSPDTKVVFLPASDGSTTRRPLLIEVKLKAELDRKAEVYEARFQAAREYCEARGWEFRVMTEEDVPRLKARNLRFLFRYRDFRADIETLDAVRSALRGESITLKSLVRSLAMPSRPEARIISTVWHLVSQRQIQVDLDKPLSLESSLVLKAWEINI